MRFAHARFARLVVPAMPLLDWVVIQIRPLETCGLILDSAITQRHVYAYLAILVMPRMYGTRAFGTSTDPSARR